MGSSSRRAGITTETWTRDLVSTKENKALDWRNQGSAESLVNSGLYEIRVSLPSGSVLSRTPLLPYFSQLAWRSSLRVIYMGGLWKIHDLRQRAELRTQHLLLGCCFFIRGSSLYNYKFEYYTTLLGVSTALCTITRNFQSSIWYYNFHLIVTKVL
jgi:hypothetical protein